VTRSPLETAARLAHPWAPAAPTDFTPDELRAAGELLARQKVSFLALRRAHGEAVMDTPLRAFVEKDAARFRAQRDAYERIRSRLEEDGVRAMLFKSAGLYPSFHYLSDNLDVLVPRGGAAAARRRLEELGYVELVNVEEPGKFLFRRFPGDGSSFAFHLHEVVGWGVPFVDDGPLWDDARRADDDPDILVPAPAQALLVTLAHWFYEDKALSLGNLILTAGALRALEGPLAAPAALAAARGWEEGFWGAIAVAGGVWGRLVGEPLLSVERARELADGLGRSAFMRRLVPKARASGDLAAVIPFAANKVAYYRKVLRDPGRGAGRRLADVVATLLWAVRWKLHIRSQRPLLVSVSGCDGSGKSLQVARLRRAFETCDVRVRVVWARGASSRLAAPLMKLGARVLGGRRRAAEGAAANGGESARFAQRQASLQGPLARVVFSWVYALDLVWPWCVRPRLLMLAGNVVICDRYVPDALVDYALFTGTDASRPPLVLRALARLAPRPRVRALLDVTPDEALRRKPEEGGAAHLEAARAAFLALSPRLRLDVHDAGASAEEVQERLARESLRAFYARYWTLVNALLWSVPQQLNPRPREARE
jgi:thymidylate kinase